MVANVLLRVSVVLLMVGLTLGMVMGMQQNFMLAPVHGHLNLVGFVLMFAAGTYYRLVPAAAEGLLAKIHAGLHLFGAIAFPGALALMLIYGPAYEMAVVVSSTIVYVAIALFAVVVFRSTTTVVVAQDASIGQRVSASAPM